MSIHRKEHPVFVLSVDGKPLSPTNWRRAKQLVQAGQAKRIWSKLNTPGIQMLVPTRKHTPIASMGIDHGTKFEGYSVIVGTENVLNVKLDLPNKKVVLKKMADRSRLRRERRGLKCRRRPARFDNRRRPADWLAPSQAVLVNSRIKFIREIARLYPITKAGVENVGFNHAKFRWGANFSTVEIGKAKIRRVFADLRITLHEYRGWETKEARERYGYHKGSDKSRDHFDSHCSDSLSIASLVSDDVRIEPGPFLVVDDSYRPVRRQLYDTQFKKGGIKEAYSRGTVNSLRKGLLVGHRGLSLILTGINKGAYRLCGKSRPTARTLDWVSAGYATRS